MKFPEISAIYATIVKLTRSPGILFIWKFVKKKAKAIVLKSVSKQMKFLLIYQI